MSIQSGSAAAAGCVSRTGNVQIGPDSVGYRLHEEALVFGGSVETATDIAVAAGQADIGDPTMVAGLDGDRIGEAQRVIQDTLGQAIDRMKLQDGDISVVLVGGGYNPGR